MGFSCRALALLVSTLSRGHGEGWEGAEGADPLGSFEVGSRGGGG